MSDSKYNKRIQILKRHSSPHIESLTEIHVSIPHSQKIVPPSGNNDY